MGDLKRRSVRGGAVTIGAQGCKFVLQMASTMVLARLLTPADFGLIAMVAPFTGFVTMFSDLGLSMATVQRAQINHTQVSVLFWINVALSVGLMCVGMLIAPAVAWFYSEPELMWVVVALSGTFVFGGLRAQHMALLRRQMRFSGLASVEVGSQAVGVVAAIAAAWYGASYWALVVRGVAHGMAGTMLSWLLSGWRPGLPRRGSGAREMVAFGGNVTGFNLANYWSRNADNILIGWWWGAGSLGIYSKAYELLMLPIRQINNPVTNVAVPGLSRLQHEPARYRRFYRRAIEMVALVSMPVVVFCAVEARALVLLVLGDQWLETVVVFQALAPAAFLGTINMSTGWVYNSLGHVDRQLRWGVFSSIVTVLIFVAGLPWGILGVAVAFSASRLPLKVMDVMYCFKGTPLKPTDLLLSVLGPASMSIGVGLVLMGVREVLAGPGHPLLEVVFAAIVYGGLYLTACIVHPSGRAGLAELLKLIRARRGSALKAG